MKSSSKSAMIFSVRHGNISTVANLIDKHGFSCDEWSGGYELLLEALRCKRSAVAKLLLSNGAKVNAEKPNISYPSPLHVAIENNENEIVEILLQKGADINVKRGQRQCSPLHIAVRRNNIEIIELLLQNEALVDIPNVEEQTPLGIAVERGFVDIVKILLQKGANVNFTSQYCKHPGSAPLHVACGKGSKGLVELLLDRGAVVNARDVDLCTPLHVTVEKGFKEIVEILLNRGADINAQTSFRVYSPLHIAVKESRKDVVDLLLKMGAPVDVKAVRSLTPLHLAVQKGGMDIVAMLLVCGADINAKTDDLCTPLHIAVEKARKDIVEFLLSRGADVNTALADFHTPLHTAMERGCIDIVELLLRSGANVNAKLNCSTPLHIAVQDNSANVKNFAELLLNNGAEVNAKTKDSITPLHISIKNNRSDLVKLLLERGAEVDSEDKNSCTALCLAVKNGCPVILNNVLQFHPDLDNKSNQDALSIATGIEIKKDKVEIIKKLLEYGFMVKPKDATNCDIISCVIENGFVKIADEIFKYGTDAKLAFNLMPLHVAAVHSELEIAKVLLKHGADVNVIDKTGKTPIYFATVNADFNMFQLFLTNGAVVNDPGELLCLAAKSGCLEIVKILLDHGCDVNYKGEKNRTALHFTTFSLESLHNAPFFPRYLKTLRLKAAELNAHVQVAEYLLQNGANVNARDLVRDTPLLTAARQGSKDIAEVLLKYGADVNAADKYGDTALVSSVRSGCLSLTRLLLENGLIVNSGYERMYKPTPLHIAIKDGDVEHVKILLEYGANVDARGHEGAAIHIATRKGNFNLVKLLLEYGADVNVHCVPRGTAYHLAARYGHLRILEILLEYWFNVSVISSEKVPPDCAPDDDFDDNCNSADTYGCLVVHFVKMVTAGLYVSKRNLKYLHNESILRHFHGRSAFAEGRAEEMGTLMSRCHKEIQIMKNTKIADSYCTYYDILTRSARRIVRLLGHDNLVQTLNEGVYRDAFPIYASMISSRFELAKKRRQLEEESKRVFFVDCVPGLPDICMDRIIHYLTNGHLMMLIRICCPANCPSR